MKLKEETGLRHMIFKKILVLAALCLSPILSPVILAEPLSEKVSLDTGVIQGGLSSKNGVRVYKSIPYAAPPNGENRWQAPQAVIPWEGVRLSQEFAPACFQSLGESRPPWTEEFMVQNSVSEDCLFLNVWTPAQETNEKLPVLVYIHGGGFNEGSGDIAVYDGAALAEKGVVLVTINYRLGVFGFLSHSELSAESEHHASGNYGLLDQIQALEWVKENISAFGGNPDKVTIAGQSAGAISVYLMTGSPLGKGLFSGAIVQSGPGALSSFGVSSLSGLTADLATAEEGGQLFLEKAGVENITELRNINAQQILSLSSTSRFSTIVDGWFLTDYIDLIYAQGKHNDVPMISGMNADEGSFFPGYGSVTKEAFVKQINAKYGDKAERFFSLYEVNNDAQASIAQLESGRDIGLMAMRAVANERAPDISSSQYLYFFTRGIPWPQYPEFRAFHTGEVPYVFSNLNKLDRPWEAIDYRLAQLMPDFWLQFAKTGNPNGEGLPTWPAYASDAPHFMVFGEENKAQMLPSSEKFEFYK